MSINFDLQESLNPVLGLPRLGVGSRRCAGNENRTEAMSVTPANLIKP